MIVLTMIWTYSTLDEGEDKFKRSEEDYFKLKFKFRYFQYKISYYGPELK